MISAFIRLTINNIMIMEKGNAVISVILCKAFNPPALSNNNASTASNTPQNTVCHFGETFAFFVAMLFITNIPESAEVTKKIRIINITKKLTMEENGIYSRNLNIKASGSPASWLSAPPAA